MPGIVKADRLTEVPLPSPGATARLLRWAGCASGPPGGEHLHTLGLLFARFPYENVTKIIRRGPDKGEPPVFRTPDQVVEGFISAGAGGTCFSLTNLFLQVLSDLGYGAVPFLAHMGRRLNVHCGVLVEMPGKGKALMDPGYLVDQPLPLVPGISDHRTRSARIRLEGADGRYRLFTLTGGVWKERYRFEEQAPDKGMFLRAWSESFVGPGMNQICLTRIIDGGYLYLHGRHLRRVYESGKEVTKLGRGDAEAAARPFGIDPRLVSQAIDILGSSRQKDTK